MGTVRGRRLSDVLIALAALFLLSYVGVRAVRIPITHDEAFSYNHYIARSFRTIVTFDGPQPANNHVLNSVLAWASAGTLGPSPFALRLPNLAAHASFLLFSWLLVRRNAPLLAAAGFVALNANPAALEFFALARGYGLSLGLLMPALYFAFRSWETEEGAWRDEALALLLVDVACLAQIVFVDVLVALFGAFTVVRLGRMFREKETAQRLSAKKALIQTAILSGFLALGCAVTVPLIFFFRKDGQLYAGGVVGFWPDTVMTVVRLSLGDTASAHRLIAPACWSIAFGLVLAHLVAALTRRRPLVGVLLIGDLACGATILQHRLFGTHYLSDRLALFFIPLFVVLVVETLAAIASIGPAERGGVTLAAPAMAIAAALHLAMSANLSHTTLWTYDANDERIVRDLETLRSAGKPIRLGVDWLFEPSLNFYRTTRGLGWLAPVTREDPLGDFDFALLFPSREEEARRRGWVEVRRYPESGALLFARSPAAVRG